MHSNLFSDKCTTHLKQVLIKTANPAAVISVARLLDALAEEKGSIASELLNKSFAQPRQSAARAAVPAAESRRTYASNPAIGSVGPVSGSAPKTAALPAPIAESLVKAVQISHKHGHRYIGTEHLLQSVLELDTPEANQWLAEHRVSRAELEKNLHVVLESTAKFPDLTAVFREENEVSTASQNTGKPSALEYFGRDLTREDAQKNIDPLIGREREVERMVYILCRRYKNNPLLLGEAGVGKTAIVEGLAKRILEGSVPAALANKKIITLDLGAMVAGTMYRGEFEARLKQAIETAEKDGNVILFIDEIHTLIGAGAASGSLDAANMLKPALARGSLSVIGATTLEEFKKHIEGDSALERRLAPVFVDEPNEDETREVLRGIKKNYEAYHNVDISNDAVDAAIEFSARFLPERLQPDKSIDLLDEAASRVKVERTNSDIWKSVRQMEHEMELMLEQKHAAVAREEYAEAIALKQKEAHMRGAYQSLLLKTKQVSEARVSVTRSHVARVISSLANVPLGLLEQDERSRLERLELDLGSAIVGQEEALSRAANLIRRSRTGVADPNRPTASFMFLGPTGVGKTETARQIARSVFGEHSKMIMLDMSEYAEPYSISKLVGSPAGYVGYRDSNAFTDKVRANPHTVILLDEIEKANSEVFNLLLQVLEEGHLKDATGRTVNFRNTIIIMTSNIGLEAFNQAARIGFEEANAPTVRESDIREQLKERFRPEFLNRIDATIAFKPLTREACRAIAERYLAQLNTRLASEGMQVTASAQALDHMVEKGYHHETGARGIRRFFQDHVEAEIAKLLLRQTGQGMRAVSVDVSNNSLTFAPSEPQIEARG